MEGFDVEDHSAWLARIQQKLDSSGSPLGHACFQILRGTAFDIESRMEWFENVDHCIIFNYRSPPPPQPEQQQFLLDLELEMWERRKAFWMHNAKKSLERRISRLPNEKTTNTGDGLTRYEEISPVFTFDHQLLAFIALRADFRESLLSALARNAGNIDRVRLKIDNIMALLIPKSIKLTDSRLRQVATRLGRQLCSSQTLENLTIEFTGRDLRRYSTLLATADHVRQYLKRLHVDISPGDDTAVQDTMIPWLASYIQDHPLLEEVAISDFLEHANVSLLIEPLISLDKLARVKLDCHGNVDALRAVTYGRLFAKKSLTTANLNCLCVGSETVAGIICAALARSYLRRLVVSGWSFPESVAPALASALTSSSLAELSIRLTEDDNRCSFLENLSHKLVDSSIRCLDIEFPSQLTSELVIAAFKGASTWHIEELTVTLHHLPMWSEELRQVFAAYVTGNTCLRRLVLDVSSFNCEWEAASVDTLHAFNWVNSSLDEIEIPHCNEANATRVAHIQYLVASNMSRQRRIHGPHFGRVMEMGVSATCRSFALAKALATVDASTRFVFLSGDEWKSREIMLEEIADATVEA